MLRSGAGGVSSGRREPEESSGGSFEWVGQIVCSGDIEGLGDGDAGMVGCKGAAVRGLLAGLSLDWAMRFVEESTGRAVCSACANCSTVLKRSSGVFLRACMTTCSTGMGTAKQNSCSEGGSSTRCCNMTSREAP